MQIDEANLNAYLDGELTGAERQSIERRLAASPQAQAVLARLRRETELANTALELLGPAPQAQPWLALKRLKPYLLSSHQPRSSTSQMVLPKAVAVTWESSTFYSDLKNSFKKSFYGSWKTPVPARGNKKILLVGLSLMMTLLILMLSLNSGSRLLRLEQPRLWLETIANTYLNFSDHQLAGDIQLISAIFNDNEIELIGYKLSSKTIIPGNPISLTLYWRGLRPITKDYVVFVQVFDSNGALLIGIDRPPAQGAAPTHRWQPNRIVGDHYQLESLSNLSPGIYDIVVGMYDSTTGQRLLVDSADQIHLAQVTVSDGIPAPSIAATTEISKTGVVVALQPISRGTQILTASVGLRPWPVNNLPPGFISNEAEIIGRVAKTDIVQGQVIVQMMLDGVSKLDPDLSSKVDAGGEISYQTDFGIQADHRGNTAANIEHLEKLRFNWVKFQMPWKEVEPIQNNYDWTVWDEVIEAYAKSGLKILLTISQAPDWARPVTDDKTVEGFPANPTQYAGFVVQVANRYRGKVHAIEVWNQQNIYYEVGGQGRIDIAIYVDLLKQAYSAIKAVNPDITVVTGGLTPTSAPLPNALDDVKYLQQLYDSGAKDYFDALGAHLPGYTNPPDAYYEGGDYDPGRGYDDDRSFFFRNTIEAYRQVMVDYGDEAKLIWPTQFGWPVWRGSDERFRFAQENSLQEQAEYTVKAYEMARQWGWVGPMFLHNLDYNVTAPNSDLANFGILNTPTYEALLLMNANRTDEREIVDHQVHQNEEIEIIIALDVSGSMAAQDFEPNRLSAAKAVTRDFIDRRSGEGIGLVTFAGEIISQIQPTLDHTMLKGAIDSIQLSWDIGLNSGTAMGLGLDTAVDMLAGSKATGKVIILLTDGANNAGEVEPLVAAEAAKMENIRIYSISVAQQGPALLPFPDGRLEYRNPEIDEETLQQIAEITDGLYFRAESIESLREVYDKISKREGAR